MFPMRAKSSNRPTSRRTRRAARRRLVEEELVDEEEPEEPLPGAPATKRNLDEPIRLTIRLQERFEPHSRRTKDTRRKNTLARRMARPRARTMRATDDSPTLHGGSGRGGIPQTGDPDRPEETSGSEGDENRTPRTTSIRCPPADSVSLASAARKSRRARSTRTPAASAPKAAPVGATAGSAARSSSATRPAPASWKRR